ncbi:SEC-C domain-containing protein [Vibrio aestuarianus]|uniref:YecA family protein n=1 Tax=Vibrio aestuarianus TaxID=28171 RepID=UPI00237CE19F|nr:SEC-C metal-binding domain-containing protein [Vibrio aestuarianus]MDE1249300.1 SEC-C domain-containing protein [Vibrio aestuarianus]
MTYHLINISEAECQHSPLFLEGAILASNFATQPLEPSTWLEPLVGEKVNTIEPLVVEQINQQYHLLKRSEYSALALLDTREQWADYAQGFMNVWPVVEEHWVEHQIGDGSLRMLQALLTTFMLAIDEEQTQQQMKESGFEIPPSLSDFAEQLDLMITEVALMADELMLGAKTQSVNPFKNVGRNDTCPCDSGKKFKQCCGK